MPAPTEPADVGWAAPPDSVERVLGRVAAWMLPGAGPPSAVAAEHADRLVALATGEGLLGPLVACLDAGVLDLPAHARDRAIEAHEAALWWCILVERRLLEIDRWFSDAGGIEYLVVKGPAVAHLDEIDPSLRSFGDLDLLIAGSHLDRALEVLQSHGARRATPPRRPGFDRRFAKGVGTAFDDGIEVDVHRSLCGGAHGFRIPLDRMFATPDHFDLGGRSIPAPARIHRVLHACYHAVVGTSHPPLRTLRDLAWYLCATVGPTREELVAEARRWRGEAVLAEAVQTTLDTFDLDLPGWQRWLDTRDVDPAEHRLLELCREPSTRPVHWSTVRELRWADRAPFLWAVAVPSRAVLQARGQTGWTRITNGLRRLRHPAPTGVGGSVDAERSDPGDPPERSGRAWGTPLGVPSVSVETSLFRPRVASEARPWVDVVAVGALRWENDLETLLRAVAEVRGHGAPLRLRLFGTGPDRQHLQFARWDLGLDGYVELDPPPGPAERAAALRRADVLVVVGGDPDAAAGTLEGMASGLPVIVVSGPHDRDPLVRDGEDGLLVSPHDVGALADALRALAEDPGLRARMGASGRRRAVDRFAADRQVDDLAAALSEAVGRGR